jgi:soluble lytic murein transglycosylase-like protein
MTQGWEWGSLELASMRFWRQFVVVSLLTGVGLAADLAVLRNGFSIRHESRELIGESTRLYTSADKASFVDIPTADIERFEKDDTPPEALSAFTPAHSAASATASPEDVARAIGSASNRYRLDPDFVNSVVSAESRFNPRAVSRKGALGLMQLMPGTASQLGVDNPFDPAKNADGGTRYLRILLERYNFDVAKALAAYNAGPARVEQHHGVPPYRETRKYVAGIIRDYNRKKLQEEKLSAPKIVSSKVKSQKLVASTARATITKNSITKTSTIKTSSKSKTAVPPNTGY